MLLLGRDDMKSANSNSRSTRVPYTGKKLLRDQYRVSKLYHLKRVHRCM